VTHFTRVRERKNLFCPNFLMKSSKTILATFSSLVLRLVLELNSQQIPSCTHTKLISLVFIFRHNSQIMTNFKVCFFLSHALWENGKLNSTPKTYICNICSITHGRVLNFLPFCLFLLNFQVMLHGNYRCAEKLPECEMGNQKVCRYFLSLLL
jgi:hypothetical protein